MLSPLAACLLLALLLTSCRYDVELYYTGKASVTIDYDWETRFGERPTGMTVMLARHDAPHGDSIIFTDISNAVDRYELDLEPGTYKLLTFNLTTGEFGSMRFHQMKSFGQAFAYAEQLQRTTDFWDVNVRYMREPEDIGCAVDTFTILHDMVDGEFRFVPWRDKVAGNTEEVELPEVVQPMTTDMYIRVKVIGIKYMASVIGNISGMADGFLLTSAWRREQTGYHLLDNWSVTRAPASRADTASVGYITTTISTFGLPHGRELLAQRDSTSNMLSLCFTLIDGSHHVFRYPVGKAIHYRNAELTGTFSPADVTLELELLVEAPFFDDTTIPILPYAQPSGTGAFDAEVAPWGDEENVDVPM